MTMIPSQNSQTPKRKSTESPSSSSSSTDEQTPPTRVTISSSSPHDGSYHHSIKLSAEFKAKRDHLFNIMPQEPHLGQLGNSSSTARKGFRLVLDIDFVNLAEKFSGSVDPLEFSEGLEEYASQLSTLEENGYNVVKLWERFDKLRRLSAKEKRNRENEKEIEENLEEKLVKAYLTSNKADSMREELKALEDSVEVQTIEIDYLKLMQMTYAEERNNILEGMSAAVSGPW